MKNSEAPPRRSFVASAAAFSAGHRISTHLFSRRDVDKLVDALKAELA